MWSVVLTRGGDLTTKEVLVLWQCCLLSEPGEAWPWEKGRGW